MKKVVKNNKMICAICFFIIYFSSDTILFGTNVNSIFLKIGLLIEVCIIISFFVFCGIKNHYKLYISLNTAVALIAFMICVLLSALANQDFRGGYFVVIIMSVLGCLWVNAVPLRTYAQAYVTVFKIIAALSIVGKILTDLFPLANIGFSVSNSSGVSFSHFVFFARKIIVGEAYRNYSIFREPGAFQFYLIVAILISLIIFDKKKSKKEWLGILILVIASLMTKSTSAYFSLILLVCFFFIREKRYQRIMGSPFLFFFGLSLLILGIVILNVLTKGEIINRVDYFLFDKFDSSSVYYESGITRVASLKTNIELWLNNPMFGVGFTNKELLYNELATRIYGVYIDCDTNTIFAFLSRFGIIACIMTIMGIIGIAHSFEGSKMERLLVILIIVVQLFSQDYYQSMPYYIWFWYGMKSVVSCSGLKYSKNFLKCNLDS